MKCLLSDCLPSALTPTSGSSDHARRVVKGVGRFPLVAWPVKVPGKTTVADSGSWSSPVEMDLDPILLPSCILGAPSWQVEERVREVQQSVPDSGGVPPHWLFIPEDEVAVPSGQANVCRKVGRQVRTALLWASQRSQQQANRRWTPALSYQPGQKVWLSTKDLPLQVCLYGEPCSRLPEASPGIQDAPHIPHVQV